VPASGGKGAAMAMSTQERRTVWTRWFVVCAMAFVLSTLMRAQSDLGPRGGEAGAGGPGAGLAGEEGKVFPTGGGRGGSWGARRGSDGEGSEVFPIGWGSVRRNGIG